MAILCTNCGKELEKDTARFCSNCGVAVLAHSSQSQLEGGKAVLREQVAEQPFSHAVTVPSTSLPRTTIRLQSISLEGGEVLDPPPTPAQQPAAVPSSPPSQPARQPLIPSRPKASRVTAPIAIPPEAQHREEVEVLDPPPTPAQQPVAVSSSPPSQHREEAEVLDPPPVPAQQPVAVLSSPPSQTVEQPLPSHPKIAQAIARVVMPAEAYNGGKRLRIIASLVCCLLVVGIVVWNILSQPFSVPAVTLPQQRFSDSHLGISLLYPNGWKALLDQHTSTARLYDSTNTAQITISITDATGKEMGQYLEQQAKEQGMTAMKSATVSFAGASWQQLQGGMQQLGANYTATMLATIHGKHLFTIIQAAPQNTYQDEERVVFAPMRRSFSFST